MSEFFSCLGKDYHYNIQQNIHDINILMSQFKSQIQAKPNLHICNRKYHIQINKVWPNTLLVKFNYSFLSIFKNSFLSQFMSIIFLLKFLCFIFILSNQTTDGSLFHNKASVFI